MVGIVKYCLLQKDGRYNIKETWTDNSGNIYNCDYCSEHPVVEAQKEPVPQIPNIVEDVYLASLAIAAKAILDTSNKIDSEIKTQLQTLVDGVKTVASANPDSGTSATKLVQEIINHPNMQYYPELKNQIEYMLSYIQETTGGVL